MTGSTSLIGFDSTRQTIARPFDAYHALYAAGADADEIGPNFHAVMRGWRLDRALLYDRRLNDVAHARDTGRVGRDGLDHFTLTLVLAGDYHIDAGSGFARVQPGEIALVDMRRPMRNRAADAHIVTLSMARSRVAEAGARLDRLHGHVIPADRGFLLADHMASIARHGPALPPAALMSIGRITIDLLGIALIEVPSREWFGTERASAERVDRVRAFIAERMGDRDLNPDLLVERFALSRATLYRDFAPWGGLARYIRMERLDRLRDLLASGDPRPIGTLAELAGFSHEGRASDAFRAAFGIRPGAYRQLTARETPFDGTYRRLREWQSELR